ncbi:MAG TPA: CHASE3 domain-containing protein, partial [Ohtaekwangia sp.]|nr:CHASE3 domain-containing protein [Ohtaekwangia sp.]
MKSNFKRNLLIGFGASLAILLISSVASFVSITNLLKSSDLVAHTQEVINELHRLNAAILDAETGQRGYLLAGEEAFLEPYRNSRDRAFQAF